ncbi:RNA polymerase sigma-70 factor [Pedobacter sp.]|jgi:RNA polymerase sigma-70 factor (family 1)|uniref:RNA polymerase sigma-70 factor n=1 Tax=Pedobacter sp. TaxID=1411316 RepID=UPI002CB0DCC2|nr:RNA polymerase sigma-70 factor [Pedobacter sp.]HWW39232.1 RNA polymerase sigma-70 factor [Pedobacter sp.]
MELYASLSDIELTNLLTKGDEQAYTEIYKRYWDKIYVVACHRIGDEYEAEEVVQDVFFSLWKRRMALDLKYSLNTYLSVAVKYQVINRQTRQFRKVNEIASYASSQEESVDTTQLWFSEKELKEQLEICINKLPEKCRIVFKMSRDQEKTNAEIARELDISEKTVEAHITRAISSLKKSLHISLPVVLYLLKK